MVAAFNPMVTSNARGNYLLQTDGYVQGAAMDSPSVRNRLSGGILAYTETLPMWGGCGIYENVSGGLNQAGQDTLGGTIGRATSEANLTGFSVFDQNHAWIQQPLSEVPSAGPGMTVAFYRFGTGARIPVAIDPALVNLQGKLITSQLSWDFNLQRLIPYAPPEPADPITGITWANGFATVTTANPHGYAVGDDVTIAGATPAGYNGDFSITGVPSPTSYTYALATNPGAESVPGQVNAGGGLLPVTVLHLNLGNSKMVQYDPVAGLVHWNNSGNAALIQI